MFTSTMMISILIFVASGCGASSVGGPEQPSPAGIGTLFGHDVTFVADRALNMPASHTGLPTDALAEADYSPLPQQKSYPVTFAADGETVTVVGDTSMVGTWDQLAGGTRRYKLMDGTFAGGRFDVWPGDTANAAELTIYGSGVPIVSSERGTLVE
jgi:hypothetical protein